MPDRCLRLQAGPSEYAIQVGGDGKATAELAVPADIRTIEASSFVNLSHGPWLGLPPGQKPAQCPTFWPLAKDGWAERHEYSAPIDSQTGVCHIIVRPIPVVTITARFRDQNGDFLKPDGTSALGVLSIGRVLSDGSVRVPGVPRDEPAILSVMIGHQGYFIPVGTPHEDTDVGDLTVEPPLPQSAKVRLSRTIADPSKRSLVAYSVLFVSMNGSRYYSFGKVDTGAGVVWMGTSNQGDANTIAPGQYIVIPEGPSSSRVAELVRRLRAGRVAGTESLPRVTTVENQVLDVNLVADEAALDLRRVVLTPQPAQ